MTSFAFKTLFADRNKLLIALVGVVFSLVLVNVQGGLFIGMIRKASVLIDKCEADIWVGHRGMKNADIASEIPEAWLNRIRGLQGVKRAEPYIVGGGMVKLPDGDFENVLVIGSSPTTFLGTSWALAEGDVNKLRAPSAVTIDELDAWRLGNPEIGGVLEINGNKARIAAKTSGILGFITTPYVFTTLDLARTYTRIPNGYCSYFLVQADEGANLPVICSQIRDRVPELDVYTAQQFSSNTRLYWIVRTGLGMSFGGSTLLGLTVGLVMVAQSLYAFVLDHQGEYATLKALGAEDGQVYRILVIQSITIAAIGSLIGNVISLLIKSLVSTPGFTIDMHPLLVVSATGLAVGICLTSSLLPFRRIRLVDPVTVLQE